MDDNTIILWKTLFEDRKRFERYNRKESEIRYFIQKIFEKYSFWFLQAEYELEGVETSEKNYLWYEHHIQPEWNSDHILKLLIFSWKFKISLKHTNERGRERVNQLRARGFFQFLGSPQKGDRQTFILSFDKKVYFVHCIVWLNMNLRFVCDWKQLKRAEISSKTQKSQNLRL